MSYECQYKFLKRFIKDITKVDRNPTNLAGLEPLKDFSTNKEIILDEGAELYRCRIVTNQKDINKEENFFGYGKNGSFVPPPEKTKDYRANYKNIPYLYCSNDRYIALTEVRPRFDEQVSVATISTLEQIRLLDLTIKEDDNSNTTDKKDQLMTDLSHLFAAPTNGEYDIIDYIPTQFIAEYIKKLNRYDGIAYTSSLTEEGYLNPDRYNIVIFNFKKCKVVKSNVYQITHLDISTKQIDNAEVKDRVEIKSNILNDLIDI